MLTRKMYVSLLVCLLTATAAFGLEVIDSRYSVSTYTSFAFTGSGANEMTFDSSGNLYILTNYNGGALYKVTPDGTKTTFASALDNPQDVVYGGGTAYGNKLYVANHDAKNILCIELNGSKSVFSTMTEQPHCVGIDPGSNYGGQMYAGTDSPFSLYKITNTGDDLFFADLDKLNYDIAIDPGTRFGGKMYLAITTEEPDWIGNILKIEPDGSQTVFLDNLSGRIDFDTTQYANFGGDLYACSPSQVRRIAPDGSNIEILHRTTGMDLSQALTFGSDGAMYLLELDLVNDMAYVRQVTPEPMTLALLAVGGLTLLKRRRIKC